jgi:hypothetical protein
MPPALYTLVIFFNWVSCSCPSWPEPWSSYLRFLNNWDDKPVPACPAFIGWNEGLPSFYPGCPLTTVLSIFASQVIRMTGVSHCTRLVVSLLRMASLKPQVRISGLRTSHSHNYFITFEIHLICFWVYSLAYLFRFSISAFIQNLFSISFPTWKSSYKVKVFIASTFTVTLK